MTGIQAVIQAGGRGMRLAPYSTVLPKALMPIGEGRAVVDGLLSMFAGGGISKVFITINHYGDLIKTYCGDGRRWGLDIEYVPETEPLGTIGPLVPMRDRLTGTFLVSNADVWIDLDLPEFLRTHRMGGAELTVATTTQRVQVAYGVLEHTAGLVQGFREKPVQVFSVSTGVYLMEPSLLDRIPAGRPYGFDDLMFSMLAEGHPVRTYAHPGRWIDIGQIDDLRRAQEQAAKLDGLAVTQQVNGLELAKA